MAQFYGKSEIHSRDTFDSTRMFLSESEIAKLNGTTYMGVLNVFRKVFKGLNINSLMS